MKSFNVPAFYRSPVISRVRQFRKAQDPRKKDNAPTVADFGPVSFYIARHFGFCYGVENAIEIAFRAVEENKGKRVFLLSEMIHNPDVNRDLRERGVDFLQDTAGTPLIPFDSLTHEDIVVIPAFGAPLELLREIEAKGIDTRRYDTTCPFVERVWKKSSEIGRTSHTIIIHGKHSHEETRSTFSRSRLDSEAVLVIRDMEEARILGGFILGRGTQQEFEKAFGGRYTPGFNITKHLSRLGVINQTTMLATETAEIAAFLKQALTETYGAEDIADHFADTRDTLCYATNENQDAVTGLLSTDATMAIVIGGYNSSNTSHLFELCEPVFPTYYISSDKEIVSSTEIHHFNYHTGKMETTSHFLPPSGFARIAVCSGASCPDSLVDAVISRIASFYNASGEPQLYTFNSRTHEHQAH